MAEWSMNRNLDSSTINGGRRYDDNDAVTPEDINAVYETLFYVNDLAKNISSVTTNLPPSMNANVAVRYTSAGRLEFAFSIPKGEKGDQGEQGIQGLQGDKGAIFTLDGDVLTITSNTK